MPRAVWPEAAGRCLGKALLVCLLFAGTVPVALAQPVDRLAQQVDDEHYSEAYELARDLRDAHAGEPRFDLYYGTAAIESGHLSEGIFALERVLIAQPGADRARLELARGYFLNGDDRRARREFRTVERRNPPAAVQAQIDRYLVAIDRRSAHYKTHVSGHIEIGAGWDSNVNNATASSTVDTTFGPFTPDSQERDDTFGRLEGRIGVSHPVAPDVNLFADVGARGRFYGDEDEFDTGRISSHFGALLRRSDWRLRGSLSLGRFYLDQDPYRDSVGANATYEFDINKRTTGSLSIDVVDFRYDKRKKLDSTLWLVGAGVTHVLQSKRRPTLSARVFAGTENADSNGSYAQANAERDLYGIRGGLRMWLVSNWTFRGLAEVRFSDYEAPGLLFDDARDEEYYRLVLAVDWHPRARWRLGPRLEYAKKDSNIALYDYERTEFQLQARYDF